MKLVEVDRLAIGNGGELLIHPSLAEDEEFCFIYRSASGVQWDEEGRCLCCPAPREWSYAQWFEQTVAAVISEYRCQLALTESTNWCNVPEEVRAEIEGSNRV